MRRFAPDGPGAGQAPGVEPSRHASPSPGTPGALERLLRFFVAPPAPQDGSAAGEDVAGPARAEELVLADPPLDAPRITGDLPRAGEEVPGGETAVDGEAIPLEGRGRPDKVAGDRHRRKPRRSPGARPGPGPGGPEDARPAPVPGRSGGARRRPERHRAIVDPRPQDRVAVGGHAPRIVVVGAATDVRAAAWVVASRVAAVRGSSTGVVAAWSADVAPGDGHDARSPHGGLVPARAGAVRIAAALSERGHDVRAAGRLVGVRLGAGPGAAAEAERVQDAAGDAPVVLALGGARGDEWDRMLPAQDLVLLAAGPRVPEALAAIALAVAQDRCGDTPVRLLAVSAGRRPRPARAALAEVLALLEAR